eukprot:TRINITY_DN9372_c2_g1_i1.p1 TRINITY_DN9372_c2_g1~~TRINITY_DN9372_c2_g1_i1.p1  ORF type:complete len:460 (-),score=59.15 TRINITY_DN9372_c2_g1_i1:135-1514(-)
MLNTLKKRNLAIRFLYIQYRTQALNNLFVKLGTFSPRFLHYWYTCGVIFGVFTMMGSVLFLLWNLYSMMTTTNEQLVLTPLLPGVNIPNSQLPYYFVALLVSGLIHEIGHGIAAISVGQNVDSFGVFLMLFYPGAFASMGFRFNSISTTAALKIICAGVWHNFILALLAWSLIKCGPLLALPLYSTTEGALVTYVHSDISAFYPSQVIVRINECEIRNTYDWEECFAKMIRNNFTPTSYCNKKSLLDTVSNTEDTCCNSAYTGSLQCWKYTSHQGPEQFCYSARSLVNDKYCQDPALLENTQDDDQDQNNSESADCGPDEYCYTPVLNYPEMILKITDSGGNYFLLACPPLYLYQSLMVSDWKMRSLWYYLGGALLPLYFPVILEKLLWFIFSISGALAILNIAPTYLLDGNYACYLLLQLLGVEDEQFRLGLVSWIFRFTLVLFAINLLVSVYLVLQH